MHVVDLVWLTLAVVFVGLEVVARVTAAVPRLGELFALFARSAAMRAFVLCGWVWLGWHFFAR